MKDQSLNELNNQVVRDIFGEDYGSDKYASIGENIISFLQGKGKILLSGDTKIIDELDSYTQQKAKEFTNQIIRQQIIRSADIAWSNKDYASFVQQINLIGKESLPESYTKKYNIASNKVKIS